jgi:lysophospholipase L1-like esterase
MGTLLVLGDSVVWGQGLAEEHKTAAILARHLGAEMTMQAHSGAKIGVRDSYSVTMPSGEIPCFFPTILQQLKGFRGDSDAVKWVLLNGGINDVEIQRVFNAMVPQYELELHTRNFCGRDFLILLRQVVRRFRRARVLVLGYYPGLSHQSGAAGVEAIYSLVHGMRFMPVGDPELFRHEIVDHCLRFWKLSSGLLRGAVEHVNREAGKECAVFVDSGMNEANSAYAPASLLWELDLGDPERPPDEVAEARRAASELVGAGPLQMRQVRLSSAGHPNVAGATHLAEQCIRALAAEPGHSRTISA